MGDVAKDRWEFVGSLGYLALLFLDGRDAIEVIAHPIRSIPPQEKSEITMQPSALLVSATVFTLAANRGPGRWPDIRGSPLIAQWEAGPCARASMRFFRRRMM